MQATRKLWKYLRPYWRWALLAPLLMVLEVAMDLLQPWLMERIIDDGVATGDLNYVLRTGAIMIGVAVIGMIGGVGCTIFAVLASQSMGPTSATPSTPRSKPSPLPTSMSWTPAR
jgi:ATP-binding cassette, subfamily B, multidrug efflux pump